MRGGTLLLSLLLLELMVEVSSLNALCGLNIDPVNPQGVPSWSNLQALGSKWVRIEFKDQFPSENNITASFAVSCLYFFRRRRIVQCSVFFPVVFFLTFNAVL